MRIILAAAFMLSLAGYAQAQTPLTGTTGPQTSAPPDISPGPARGRRSLQARFEAANTTHDGHLTLEQAQAGLPAVARDFARIDTQSKGYVTVDEVRGYNQARRAERAAKSQ